VGSVGQTDIGQRLLGSRRHLGARQAEAGQTVAHVGAHRAPREESRLLERQRRRSGDHAFTGVIVRQSRQHPQYGGLARSAAADQRDDLAVADRQ